MYLVFVVVLTLNVIALFYDVHLFFYDAEDVFSIIKTFVYFSSVV